MRMRQVTYSSCLADVDCKLVLDSSVVINLLATGQSELILRALDMPIMVTENVVREIEAGATSGYQQFHHLMRLIDDGLVQLVKLEGQALQAFFEIASGTASETLGDGEAATLAFAHATDYLAAIDEKKATILASRRFATLRIATTIDILAHASVRGLLGERALADSTVAALRTARMQARDYQLGSVLEVIGHENAAACSSLRRLMKRRARSCTSVNMRIPTKPATHSNRKPATDSDLKPAGIPI
jgi:predicted nucleic acid-binding protein